MTDASDRSGSTSSRGEREGSLEPTFGKRTSTQWTTLAVAWFGLIVVIAFVLWQAAANPTGLSNPWADLAFAGLLGLFASAAYGATQLKPFDVRDGIITLPWPIRDAVGKRRRRISLREIRSVAPARSERQSTGVIVTLKDGATFYLWDPDLPPGASAYLLRTKEASAQTAEYEEPT